MALKLPHLAVSLRSFVCLAQYALQVVLLVLWQLIVPVVERFLQVVLQCVFLAGWKLLVPIDDFMPHCSVVTNSVQVLTLIRLAEQ